MAETSISLHCSPFTVLEKFFNAWTKTKGGEDKSTMESMESMSQQWMSFLDLL
jgi:hypothetical protein